MERIHKGIEYDYKHVTIFLFFTFLFPLKAPSLFTVPASSAVSSDSLFAFLGARSAREA